TRRQIKTEGSGCGLPVDEPVDGRAACPHARRLDPEFAKKGKALVLGSGLDAERSRGKPIFLLAPQKAEIARAEEGDHLVIHMRIVERIMQSESGEAEIDRQRRVRLDAPIVEERGRIGDRRGDPVPNEIDRDGTPIEKAQVKGLEAEGIAARAEHRLLRPEADFAPRVIVELVEGW